MTAPFAPLAAALLALLPMARAPRETADSMMTADSLAASLMDKGVSHALAEHRARQIGNVRYALALDVTRRDTVVGHVRVRFDRRREGDVILDFRGLALTHATANGRAVPGLVANGAHVRVPASALTSGENAVEFDFRSAIAPAGASVIRFHDTTDGADYLYTLLVPADANALFPCFDQPDLKARVTLSLTTPPGWTALANGARAGASSGPAATTFRFRETEPLSTYLVAFAAGPWAMRQAVVRGRPITMYVRASRAREAEADSLIALNARALDWLERYTARPFPFQKFDFLLAPAFPFGGMEHPGAVFYNEESFIYRERPTLNQLLGREATIFHEVAHQWFGDLVTMRWFDDLWLKEGFATYLAAVMQDAIDPRADAWKTFYLRNKPVAYAVDASRGTTPVWQSLGNLDQAKSNYGAIVYNKAPGILKQLNYLVGDTAFRDGLRAYVTAHAHGNATWGDLLAAVGMAAHQDLAPWGRAYVLRPGMPVIEQQLGARAGGGWTVELTQHPAQPLSGVAPWPIRTRLLARYADGTLDTAAIALDAHTTARRLARRERPALVFANAGDFAYALVHLDSGSVRWLEGHIGDVRDPLLRPMLWGALWDLVRDARLAPARFVRTALGELPAEQDEQVAPFIVGRLARAVEAYLSEADRAALRPEVERVLIAGVGDTTRAYSVRKAQLDAYIELAQSSDALAHLDALLDSATAAGAPLRAPTRWAIVTTLVARDAPGAAERLAAESHRDSTSEGKRRAFVAGAAQPTASAKRAYWVRYFGDRELNEDWVTASLGAFNTMEQDELTRRYLVPALDSLPWIQRNRRIFFLGSWLGAVMQGQRSPGSLALVERFLREHPALPGDLRAKILQSADELERTVRIHRAFGS